MTSQAWRWVFAAALVLQFVALYRPNPPAVASGLPLDKLVHVGLFAAVALLGMLAGIPLRWLLLGLIAQAALSEMIQALIPGRGPDFWDFLADLVGILLGIGVGRRLRPRPVRTA